MFQKNFEKDFYLFKGFIETKCLAKWCKIFKVYCCVRLYFGDMIHLNSFAIVYQTKLYNGQSRMLALINQYFGELLHNTTWNDYFWRPCRREIFCQNKTFSNLLKYLLLLTMRSTVSILMLLSVEHKSYETIFLMSTLLWLSEGQWSKYVTSI